MIRDGLLSMTFLVASGCYLQACDIPPARDDSVSVARAGSALELCPRWNTTAVVAPGVDGSAGLRARGGTADTFSVLAHGRDGTASLLPVDAISARPGASIVLPAGTFGTVSDALPMADGWAVVGGDGDRQTVSVYLLGVQGQSLGAALTVRADGLGGAPEGRVTLGGTGVLALAWRDLRDAAHVRSVDGTIDATGGTIDAQGEWGPDAYYAPMDDGRYLCGLKPRGGYSTDTRMPGTVSGTAVLVPAIEGGRTAMVDGTAGVPRVVFANPGRGAEQAGSAGYTVDTPVAAGSVVRGVARPGGAVLLAWLSPADATGNASLQATEVTPDGLRGAIVTLATVRGPATAVTVARAGTRALVLTSGADGTTGAVMACAD